MIPVTIYSSPDCQPCKLTKRWFAEKGITFTEVDVTLEENASEVAQMGIRSLPYTVIGNWPIKGFDPPGFKLILEDNGYVVR